MTAIDSSVAISIAEQRELEQVEGIVFDIQRYSVHDGPGLRTNVFLKGCPLRCAWCANPESQQMQPELMLSAHNCMSCGQFAASCPVCWEAADHVNIRVEELGDRPAICPTGAIHWVGARRLAGEVMAEVRRDAPFYGNDGGLTLTGGEATMQPAFAEALLRLARAEGIHTALETAGHTQWTVFERLLPHLDLLLYDVKQIDSDVHRRYTGLSNALILDNLRRIARLPAPPIVVRVPVIPGFNADAASLTAIASFVLNLERAPLEINLLSYHTLGRAKYQSLGRDYPWADQPRLAEDEMQRLAGLMADQVLSAGIVVRVGG